MYVRTLFQVWPKWLSTVLITAHFIIYHCTFWVYHCTNWLSLHTKIRYVWSWASSRQLFKIYSKETQKKYKKKNYWYLQYRTMAHIQYISSLSTLQENTTASNTKEKDLFDFNGYCAHLNLFNTEDSLIPKSTYKWCICTYTFLFIP